jgi:hypothetical protein
LYLNSKFYKNNLTQAYIFDKKINQKKLINIYFVDSLEDYYKDILIKDITKLIENRFIINITSVNPDYLIFDIFDCEHLNLKYSNTIKIGIYTENQFPDFNLNSTDGFRIKFINELSKYKKVDMGGIYKNNVGGIVRNKIRFLSAYKFSIAMENSEGQGYISEKIFDSFIAGTIPIYYGGYMLDEFINPKSYILIKNEEDMLKKIEYIKQIDNDAKLYTKILSEKPFINDNLISISEIEKAEFFNHIFEQKKDEAKRIDNYHFNYIQ